MWIKDVWGFKVCDRVCADDSKLCGHYFYCRRVEALDFQAHGLSETFLPNKFYLSRKKTSFFADMKNEGIDILSRHAQNGEISIAKPNVDAFVALGSPASITRWAKIWALSTG